MKNTIPRIAAIHDLSGIGRCSLGVVIPTLSCMGIQVCSVPTAVLSTHTGGFGKPVFKDLTFMMDEYIKHWNTLGKTFDCIYSGFLGSSEQIDSMEKLVELFKKDHTLVVVDPVMGDDGVLYSTYDETMQSKMRQLVSLADLITPNWTETCFLLQKAYTEEEINLCDLKEMLKKLSDMGPKWVVITGVPIESGKKINAVYDRVSNKYWQVFYDEVPIGYSGTGDTFTSVLVGALLQGESLVLAVSLASAFVQLAVEMTYGSETDIREGVLLEKALPFLCQKTLPHKYASL